ncbi:MAG: signal peptidase II [bacterium]
MLKFLWLSLLVVVLDQASKYSAHHLLELHQPVPVITGFFNLFLAYNEGAAFSFLSDAGGWQRWFFTALAASVSVILVIWLHRLKQDEKITAWALALILGGAVGNLIDRVLLGHVIDFIQWHYKDHYWPAFNIADSAITLGAVLLISNALFTSERKHKEEEGKSRG